MYMTDLVDLQLTFFTTTNVTHRVSGNTQLPRLLWPAQLNLTQSRFDYQVLFWRFYLMKIQKG